MIRLDVTGSTSNYLAGIVASGLYDDGTLVIASRQTAGRGLDNNIWESEPGMNLTFSFVLCPEFLPPEDQFYLHKVTSLAVADMVATEVEESVRVKWPNDVYIGDRKVAGILVQNGIRGNTFQYALVGIGLNINQEVFYSGAPNPVSLYQVTGKRYDLEEMLAILCRKLDTRYDQLRSGRRALLDGDYLRSLYRFHETARYEYRGGVIEAMITGVSGIGHLQLETAEGTAIECDLKEVRFL